VNRPRTFCPVSYLCLFKLFLSGYITGCLIFYPQPAQKAIIGYIPPCFAAGNVYNSKLLLEKEENEIAFEDFPVVHNSAVLVRILFKKK